MKLLRHLKEKRYLILAFTYRLSYWLWLLSFLQPAHNHAKVQVKVTTKQSSSSKPKASSKSSSSSSSSSSSTSSESSSESSSASSTVEAASQTEASSTPAVASTPTPSPSSAQELIKRPSIAMCHQQLIQSHIVSLQAIQHLPTAQMLALGQQNKVREKEFRIRNEK